MLWVMWNCVKQSNFENQDLEKMRFMEPIDCADWDLRYVAAISEGLEN